MAFKKGDPKPPNSGRRRGVKNKRTLLRVEDFLADQNINPVQLLLNLLPTLPPSDAAHTLIELLKFCQPQLKPSEASARPPEPAPNTSIPTSDLIALVKKNPA